MTAPELKYTKLVQQASVPIKGTPGAAGYDLAAAFDCYVEGRHTYNTNILIRLINICIHFLAHGVGVVRTGLMFEFPPNTYGRIAPRSGLASRNIDVSAGVIDSGKTLFI